MNAAGVLRGRHLLRAVAPQQRHVALPQPRDGARIEAGGLLGEVPRPHLRAAYPPPRADEQRIACRDLHARLLFPRLQVLGINRRSRLQVFDSLQPRDVDQDAAGHDAVLEVVNRIPAVAAALRDGIRIRLVPVVEHTVVRDMRQRIEVGVRIAVIPDLVLIDPHAQVCVPERPGRVRGFLRRHVPRQRDHEAFFREGHRLFSFRRRDQIDGSYLIIRAPASPVGQLFLPPLGILFRDDAIRSGADFLRHGHDAGEHRNRRDRCYAAEKRFHVSSDGEASGRRD